MVEIEARIIANVDIKQEGGEIDAERLNFREDLIEALKKIPGIASARVVVLDGDGEVLGRANFARDVEARRG
jgi:hypothetical protein